ncbi:alpha/beta hydrolase [Chryseobacterium sp.]|uniref:alpha/beta hydrolase n=1 Tax=Chryseobacterium sp. TaxID=1871047 RepID=UPI0028A148CE|nr:alpha/beta hydrolase [Chryseobacterium sp.]
MKKYLLLLILIIVGCKEKTIDVGNNNSFSAERNISYGEDSEQKLDLYSLKNKDSIKGIFLFIHGGGWKAGDKSQLTSFAFSMMEKFPDYAFANMNYRLAYESRFAIPNQTDDINKAITFLNLKFKNNPQYILLGNSAGGHLSMLHAYQFDNDQKVKAVVNIVGPSDLYDVNFSNYSDYSFVEKHLVDTSKILKK